MELVKQRTLSPGQTYVSLSRSISLPKLNILSDFDLKTIKLNNSVLEHYEYLREEKNSSTKTASFKNPYCIVKYMWNVSKDLKFYRRLKAYEYNTYMSNRDFIMINSCW